jgi:hypothetical protein
MGARHPAQLEPLEQVMGWSLGNGAIEEIERIVRVNVEHPIGPDYMAPPARSAVQPNRMAS